MGRKSEQSEQGSTDEEEPDYQLRTEHGYPLDQVISALQKEIRRGHPREAFYWAVEANQGYPLYVWRRLTVCVCEDIGMANIELVGVICNLASEVFYLRQASPSKSYDMAILAFAVLAMCESPKSRAADDLANEILRARRLGLKLEIPPYAIDMHTEAGRKLGRTAVDFWTGPDELRGSYIEHEAFPSLFVGWDPIEGDAEHTADGKKDPPSV